MNELSLTDKSRRRPPEAPDAWTAKSRHRSSRRELDTGDRPDAPRTAARFDAVAKAYPHMRVHDLRHLHAVNLVRMGLDLPAVQTVLGHTTLISTLRYAEYADGSAVRRAVAAIDEMHARAPDSTDGAAGGTSTTPEPSMPVTS